MIEENISEESSIKTIYENMIINIYDYGYEDKLISVLVKESDIFQECHAKYMEENYDEEETD
jgi:hypothetical protein